MDLELIEGDIIRFELDNVLYTGTLQKNLSDSNLIVDILYRDWHIFQESSNEAFSLEYVLKKAVNLRKLPKMKNYGK